jgi:hypothetical protein
MVEDVRLLAALSFSSNNRRRDAGDALAQRLLMTLA